MESIDMPLLEHCWLQGFRASQAGSDESSNPYRKYSKEAFYWREGWWECFFNENNVVATFA